MNTQRLIKAAVAVVRTAPDDINFCNYIDELRCAIAGTIEYEFLDYDTSTLPEIPEHWIPAHYGNDISPSWLIAGKDCRAWIDYPEPLQRETPESARYMVTKEYEALLETDDVQAFFAVADACALVFGPPILE